MKYSIVAVHGLGSDVDWSWTWRDRKTAGQPVNWLKDPSMLPSAVPQARIMAYTYGTRRAWNGPKIRIQSCAEDLARDLHEFRSGDPSRDRPILFIGHSLGGHVVEHALLYADRRDDLRYLAAKTVGLVALGTPFNGTRATGTSASDSLITTAPRLMFLAGSHRGLLRDLTHDSQLLRDKLREFSQLPWSIPVCCFYEQHETDYGRRFGYPGLVRGLVVPEESACVEGWSRVPLQAEHIKLNKFPSPHDLNFLRVSRAVADMCRRRKIKGRSKSLGYEPASAGVKAGLGSGAKGPSPPGYRLSRQATEPQRRVVR